MLGRLLSGIVSVVFLFAACGGKTIEDLDASNPDSAPPPTTPTTTPTTTIDAGGRTCPATCTVGHQCCQGSCGGIPVAMPSDCCSCLPGEVGSETCSGGKCGT